MALLSNEGVYANPRAVAKILADADVACERFGVLGARALGARITSLPVTGSKGEENRQPAGRLWGD
jgi:hypothetical protein